MADSAAPASPRSRPSRAASKKRRASNVCVDTENRSARAARPAQRLAQLAEAARDNVTLDLFPDDPTRATLAAMSIDVRQGTFDGFELPDVVRAALTGDALAEMRDGKVARRSAGKTKEPADADASDEPWGVQKTLLECEAGTDGAASLRTAVDDVADGAEDGGEPSTPHARAADGDARESQQIAEAELRKTGM